MWPDRRLNDLLRIRHPILLGPMAGAGGVELAVAVGEAGGLASLPMAMLAEPAMRDQIAQVRARTRTPLNINFFCHQPPAPDADREAAWRARLEPYYREAGIDPVAVAPVGNRTPFEAAHCALVEELRPEVVSFHFGLPDEALLARVKAAGCVVLSSATTVAEARWLEHRGCDAIIAQGLEAGGHRGLFLTEDPVTDAARQVGTFGLVPQVVDAVRVPVIAAGGIADARGIVAALVLGAAGVQVGTAFLQCPESIVLPPHRAALASARDDGTAVTNVMTGRPARGLVNRAMRELGPISDLAPAFPLAGSALAPLHTAAQTRGSGDFSAMWAGQAAALGHARPARDVMHTLVEDTQALLGRLSQN